MRLRCATRRAANLALAAAGAGLALAGCAGEEGVELTSRERRLVAGGISDAALQQIANQLDPSARQLAERHDPWLRRKDFWGRPTGWETFDTREIPDIGLGYLDGPDAVEVNALKPFAPLPIRPMRPFVLKAAAGDRDRALRCLAQAVYYEAAREPLKGQEAVAQVVLNRVRHPAYPKSICGVVYQGSLRATGCQFTFTCDGSLAWAPEPALWNRAMSVARRALGGYVAKEVGPATHYHATYVAPYWAPTLVKMTQVGAHIFYRWTGPWGEPPAFTGRYTGREADLTPQLLAGLDARTQGGLLAPEAQGLPAGKKVTLSVAGEVKTYAVADPNAPDGQRTRVMGTLQPSRRQPTPEEIKRINESLAAMEKGDAAPAASPAKAEADPAAPPH
ncbi:cell wall hydrolase [Phenylobacterium deserti]|uniref:Cell wall hydrolase n=1 Tax=Phenylobacterium deserti TaxID=1914756 RepID=A0A328AF50_9CAUL|nr:cell wall hydrolase [Phenylobacterium deserti]RAK51418.1 cell wall hydrolase [Phenylobacterium deserti]